MRGEISLVFNAGSSSIKYSLFRDFFLVKQGYYERLKTEKDFKESIKKILKEVDKDKVDLIIHRVVHGGKLKISKVDEQVKKQIRKFSEFAPLHNPHQLKVIELCEEIKKPQYAVFDTGFFSEIPEIAKTYAIPKEITKKYGIRKYGFHGLSHESASKNLKGRTITCHFGSGVSISALIDGKPVDTSMGFTPLEGIMMGTRSGSIDPGIIIFLEKKGYDLEDVLTNKSGLKGISGYSDFRDVRKKMKKDRDCKMAYEMFIYQTIKIIGSYIAILNGIDNLVFTAKIGENVPELRKKICENLSFAGIKLDLEKNRINAETISSKSSKVKVCIRKTDEEKIMVEKIMKIYKNKVV